MYNLRGTLPYEPQKWLLGLNKGLKHLTGVKNDIISMGNE